MRPPKKIMLTISGYQISEKLYEGRTSHFYRAQRDADSRLVILKVLTSPHPSPDELERFTQNYTFIHDMELPGVVKALSLENQQEQRFIVLENFDGEPLSRLNLDGRLALSQFLELAIALIELIDQLHQHQLICNLLHPGMILVKSPISIKDGQGKEQPELHTWQVRLIDVSHAARFSERSARNANPEIWDNFLPYLSPEQTGRMNREVDHRADFYSLGVILYELLTGQRPFLETDALALVHAHLAKMPVPPADIIDNSQFAIHNSQLSIPSDIIMKLLAKNPEDRYQSAYGLKADLQRCLNLLKEEGQIDDFPLGWQDVPDHLHLPQKLYGREQEFEILKQTFEHVSAGGRELLLVKGYSGVGKTALVNEIQIPVIAHGGYMLSGKFDQYQRNIPYAGITSAFQAFVRQLLTEGEAQLQRWKASLLRAVGPNGQVVIDVIPELEQLLGPQPAVSHLGPLEAQNRFNYVFSNVFKTIAQEEHPVVLFLDDLQWVDLASLHLLQTILTDPELSYFLLISAYRDNEVDNYHPLIKWRDELRQANVKAEEVQVPNLSDQAVNSLIAEALGCDPSDSFLLTQAMYVKTGGNALFTHQLLQELYADGGLCFDGTTRHWHWDIERLQTMEISDNVVDLLMGKIQRLSAVSQQILSRAACLGVRFGLGMLNIVVEYPENAIRQTLDDAVRGGLLVPVNGSYRFVHDRIQQAVYSLIPEAEHAVVHRQIGSLLLQYLPEQEREEQLFDIVNHLNAGLELLETPEQKKELAELNLSTGKKAKANTAYEAAFNYFQHGRDLLGDNSWHSHYHLTLYLSTEAAEAAYLCINFERAEQLIAGILQHAQNVLEKVPAYEGQILAEVARQQQLNAIAIARDVLNLLDVEIPIDVDETQMMAHLQAIQDLVSDRETLRLTELPKMRAPEPSAAMRILLSIMSPAYISAPSLLPAVIMNMIRLSLRYGNSPESAFAYASYSFILVGVLQDIDAGYRFGQLALSLEQQFNALHIKTKIDYVVYTLVFTWKEHLREQIPRLAATYQHGLEQGDREYGSYAGESYCNFSLHAGKNLVWLDQEMVVYCRSLEQLKRENPLHLLRMERQTLLNLKGQDEEEYSEMLPVDKPWLLIGEAYNETATLPHLLEVNDENVLSMLYMSKTLLAFFFDEFPQALEYVMIVERYLEAIFGLFFTALFYFYDSLIRLKLLPGTAEAKQHEELERIAGNQEKMKFWAEHAPMNFLHKYHLVEAERAAFSGRTADAMRLYEQATTGAKEQRYLHEEALSYELSAKCYLTQGLEEMATLYMHNARDRYTQWGAMAKVSHLERRYAALFERPFPGNVFSSATHTSSNSGINTLDSDTILKAAQMLFRELDLVTLLRRLMQIMLENAGADKGALFLEHDGHLLLEAEGGADDTTLRVMLAHPLEETSSVSQAIINYVSRTRQTIVLDDALTDERFAADHYIREHRPKSILCLPIVNQNTFLGQLYLENTITTAAFTADRVQVLELLASQAAISLENARSHAALRQEIQARQQVEEELHQAVKQVEQLNEQLQEENIFLQEELSGQHTFYDIIGQSAELKYALLRVQQAAPTDTTVLIEGETGVGKELFVRAIHQAGPRHRHPLVKVNCAAIPANLIESELFGHEKGAFTGATTTRRGRFELADGGTLFLDEIGELPLELQAKLLRVLQDKRFERVGGQHTMTVDVRIIAATNRDLKQEITNGRFREDLYYRLSVYPLSVPPLRQRKDDIPLLVKHFTEHMTKKLGKPIDSIPQNVMTELQEYSWPGNVRELQNVIERAVITTSGPKLRLAEKLKASEENHIDLPQNVSLEEMERQYITQVLKKCNWKIEGKDGAARILALKPSTLRFRMKKLGITRPV